MSNHIIGIIGEMGHGKTTAANVLVDQLEYERVHPAYTIRRMLEPFFQDIGFDEATIARLLEGDLKRSPISELMGLSSTDLQQTLGTEWGRDLVHPDIWCAIWKNRASWRLKVVNDSIRFPNECRMILEAKGHLIKIVRPNFSFSDQSDQMKAHISEAFVPFMPYHMIVYNDGDEFALSRKITQMAEQLRAFAADGVEIPLHGSENAEQLNKMENDYLAERKTKK